MQLSVREAARYLGVSEDTVHRWVKERALPAHRLNERIHLNAVELWEWATEHGVAVSRELLDRERKSPEAVPMLATMLSAGGIHHDVPGVDRASVLREVVARLPLPREVEPDFVLAVLEAREAMGSTGIGEGIAIPHVRNPILLQVGEPTVTLCLLRAPVDFDALDGEPVYALFTVVSSTVPAHLRILARLGFVLRDETLRGLLRARSPEADLLDRIRYLEAGMAHEELDSPRRPR
ncbi:MAG: PTS sugar transporter subunit IIA [Candidatus Eisenbacteria bacterium]|nr:PTS sugar transporter subunit IIA [Candidatus Eisenbacteria bacterium]